MTLVELKELIARGESETVEFKETTGQRGEACRTLCAFLNGNGGVVVFGVSRKGKLVGQIVSDETKKDLAHAFCDFEPGNFNPESASQDAYPGMASSPRNPSIAKVLYLRKAIEMWGRGISLILESCSKAHLNPPKIYEDHGFIYTVFTRPTAQEWKDRVGEDSSTTIDHGGEDNESNGSVKSSVKSSVKKLSSAEKIVAYLRDNPTSPAHELSQILNLTVRAVEKNLKTLRESGRIRRIGPDKGGHWEVIPHEP